MVKLTKKKTVSKSKSSKKNTSKKTQDMIEVTIKKNLAGEAPEEYHFMLSDGKKLKSLFELANALDSMGDDIFQAHVSDSKNDFSNWVRDIFEEPDLAEEMDKINDRLKTQVSVMKYLLNEVKRKKTKISVKKRGG